jgi:NADPH:quinone reductase-like Zn-dependent oxidoreductase
MSQSISENRGSAMTAPFRACVVDHTADGFQMGIQQLEQRDVPPGDVLIQVAYAAVNDKDTLVCIPNGNVARASPLVLGLELTGAVVESTDLRFQPGDPVLAYDFGSTQGIAWHGGYSEYARMPGDFLFLRHFDGGTHFACYASSEHKGWVHPRKAVASLSLPLFSHLLLKKGGLPEM